MDVGVPNLERWLTNVSDADMSAYLLVEATDPQALAIRATVPPVWMADNMVNKRGVDPVAARQLGLEIFTLDPPVSERLSTITCRGTKVL